MSHLTTPVKGQDSASSFVGSPSYSSPSSSSPLFSSPSFSSPSSRGKAESLVGYLVAVGPKQKSKKKNWYYVVHLQVSHTDLVQITMMESMSRGNPRREEFLPLVTQPLKFNNVYPGETQSAYFYTQNQQSTWEVTEEQAFTLDDLTSPIELINTKTNGVFHVKGMLRWLDEMKPVTNGAYRFALIGDVSSHMRMKIWKEEWFKLDEEKVYLFTNLQVQEYFGFYLSTKYHSTYAETGEEITPSWPSDMDQYIVKIRTTTIKNVEITSISLSCSVSCPTCYNPIAYMDGEFLECAPCKKTFRSKKCKFEVKGSIDVEEAGGENITLSITNINIDELYGDGTARRSAANLTELKHRLLREENLVITFVEETNKVTAMTRQDVTEQKKQKMDDAG